MKKLIKKYRALQSVGSLTRIVCVLLAIAMLAACQGEKKDNSSINNSTASSTISENENTTSDTQTSSEDSSSSSEDSSSLNSEDMWTDDSSDFENNFDFSDDDYEEAPLPNYSVNKSFCPAGYKRVWGDDFNGKKLDENKWMFLDGMGSTPDMYALTTDDVVRVEDGLLKIEAIHYFDPYGDPKVQYATNVSVTTAGTMNYKYGYLEMCAKLPYKNGTWPSFWLKGVNEKRYQDNFKSFLAKTNIKIMPEIDIFEAFGSLDTVVFNLHKWDVKATNNIMHTSLDGLNYNRSYTFENSLNLTNEFHVYAFEWTPKEMSVYVDGNKYFTYDLSKDFDNSGMGMDCFHVPMYIVLNNHLYTPEGTSGDSLISAKDLPSHYHIDWINLYQKTSESELYTTE